MKGALRAPFKKISYPDYATPANLARLQVAVDESIELRAGVLVTQGLRTFDALHLACAEAGRVTVMLTTDDRLLRWAIRQSGVLQMKGANPASWLLEVTADADP